jgi:hypothetical protein
MSREYITVSTETDIDVYPEDLDAGIVESWISDHATEEDRNKLLLLIRSNTIKVNLTDMFESGLITAFDVVEFLKKHLEVLSLHKQLFPEENV